MIARARLFDLVDRWRLKASGVNLLNPAIFTEVWKRPHRIVQLFSRTQETRTESLKYGGNPSRLFFQTQTRRGDRRVIQKRGRRRDALRWRLVWHVRVKRWLPERRERLPSTKGIPERGED